MRKDIGPTTNQKACLARFTVASNSKLEYTVYWSLTEDSVMAFVINIIVPLSHSLLEVTRNQIYRS